MIISKALALAPALLAAAATTASPFRGPVNHHAHDANASAPAPARTVYQFANGTWVENVAVRPNGNLLVTLLAPHPDLYEIDPSTDPASATLVRRFAGYANLLGIAEARPDIFALVAANSSVRGSHAVWTADFNGDEASGPEVAKAADVPEAVLLNGLAALPGGGAVLVSDTWQGNVRRVGLRDGKVDVVLEDVATMAPPPNASALGINGVRFSEADGFLYYVNSYKQLVARVEVDEASGEAVGPFEVLVSGVFGDDFALGRGGGVAYVAEGWREDVVRVELRAGGEKEVVVGGLHETTVAGATSAAWGRRKGVDEGVLYVTTCGAQEVPVNGTYTEGGKIVAVDVGSWR